MKDRYSKTQEALSELIEEVSEEIKKKGNVKSWNKYFGDCCARIFGEFIGRELPPECQMGLPNAYIEGFPTEFDLLVVKKGARTRRYTNQYDPGDVLLGFEIKYHGVFGGREVIRRGYKKLKDNFDAVRNKHPHINFIYITYQEVPSPKKETSIHYLDETIKGLRPYKVFCMRDSRKKELFNGQWESLVSSLKESLSVQSRG